MLRRLLKNLYRRYDRLLDQAQIERGTFELRNDLFKPCDLIENINSIMGPLARNRKLALKTHIALEVPEVLIGDFQRLQDILINLVSNAVKFTDQGSVSVEISLPDAEHWAIAVVDTGAGISAEAQTYIFEPFRQVDGSATRQKSGVGLGLSIVAQLVTVMEGEITLDSKENHGSTFTVALPLIVEKEVGPEHCSTAIKPISRGAS
jgi:signal transduction histidine kinase